MNSATVARSDTERTKATTRKRSRMTFPTSMLALSAVLAVTFIMVSVATGALAATTATTNLALNRPASASSTESASFPANYAVDGNGSTRWSSKFADPQWIQVDLGQSYAINRVKLTWETAYAKAYQIQVSNDASKWTTIYNTNSGNGGSDDFTVNGTGRYVRMYGTKRATSYGYSLYGFEVYGSSVAPAGTAVPPATATTVPATSTVVAPTATTVPATSTAIAPTATAVPATPTTTTASTADLALKHIASASSTETSSYPASNAVDGNAGTRWSSQFSDPQWIQVDLGQAYAVNRVKLTWEAAYGKAYQIQVSNDASTWTTIYSTTTGTGGTNDLTGLNGTGRYVRMYGSQRGTTYGYSLYGFEVYSGSGTVASAPTSTPAPAPTIAPSSTNPSGQAMPVGDIPGWRQIFAEDFKTNVPIGGFPGTTYSSKWSVYPDGWKDTSKNGTYMPSKVLSVQNGMLDYYIHSENGVHMVSAPLPKVTSASTYGQTYGRYVVRFRADALHGYKTAWLLWPDSEVWPGDGEIDFPEGNLDGQISAFAHYANSGGGQDVFPTSATYGPWHTAAIEWMPGSVKFYMDGALIGTSTKYVPSKPMHWVLQTETNLDGYAPADSVAGHVQIDWVAAYAPQ